MRNTQQKVIAIFYLLVVIGLTFFAPKYSDYSNRSSNKHIIYSNNSNTLEFVSIWTTDKIDWFKFGYIFFLISLFFILLFYFYRNKPRTDFNSPTFKRKVKRELKVFVFGVLAFGLFLGFIEGFNLYQENRKDKIEKKIDELDNELYDYREKIIKQERFMDFMDETFDLSKYNGDVEVFFESWIKKSEEQNWLNYIVKTLSKTNNFYTINDGIFLVPKKEVSSFYKENPIVKKIPTLEMPQKFKEKLKEFEVSKYEQNNAKEKINKTEILKSEKDGLFFFVRDGYIKSILLFLSIEILVLYVLRFGFYGVKSLNNYLKDE